MAGCWCAASAVRVTDGIELRCTNSTLSPERAAQAAAGIENSGLSPDATTTLVDGFPRTTELKRSIAAAR